MVGPRSQISKPSWRQLRTASCWRERNNIPNYPHYILAHIIILFFITVRGPSTPPTAFLKSPVFACSSTTGLDTFLFSAPDSNSANVVPPNSLSRSSLCKPLTTR
jgi:hypothetical protein